MSRATAYNIEPAGPFLAHSLLGRSKSTESGSDLDSTSKGENPERGPLDVWNLKADIERGLHASADDLFHPGTVIGFSRLRGRSPNGNDDDFVGEPPRYLLTNWLHRTPATSTPENRAFIIHPANLTIFSPETLLASLLCHQPPLPRSQAISCLDSVQLFPVFDLAAAVQAINEVSDILHSFWETRQTEDDDHRNQSEAIPHSITLIVAGLDTLTEAVIRASNAVRGTAVLSSVLRTLTQLSRMHRSYLSVVLVNTSGVGSTVRDDAAGTPPQSQRNYDAHQSRDDGIQSMFCLTDEPLFPSLLMRTLDQGIDTHLLVSNTRRAPVVEVIKDRVGSGVGKWCTWEKNQ
ncbi:uncharacterized protein BJX67DRAFT_112904 [Aspergillus lucknowensis]|uniref:Uncharacterized protein n=1 Tax=Aspergillus lucknowensis TaxID=176173 RepID=A0ABR4LSF3_9EURO